jgi:bifunctional non-homologous end joining protein LigD
MLTTSVNRTVTLRYREGGSDKVYTPYIHNCNAENRYIVGATYGRYGSTQSSTIKLTNVTADVAIKAYDKLVAEKVAKGYQGVDVAPPTVLQTPLTSVKGSAVVGSHSGITVQLLTEVSEDDAQWLIRSDAWVLQEKMDGHRFVLIVQDGIAAGAKRRGLHVEVPIELQRAARAMPDVTLDGELIGTTFYAFDLLAVGGHSAMNEPFFSRHALLHKLLTEVGCAAIREVPVIAGTFEEKAHFIEIARSDRREGVVLRDKHAPYTPGRPNRGGSCRKLKFVASASVVVIGHTDRHSVTMGLYDEHGNIHDVGNVTVAPSSPKPKLGSVIDVQYLYAHPLPGGCLQQPTMPRVRDDIDSSACTTSQLKFKAEVDG